LKARTVHGLGVPLLGIFCFEVLAQQPAISPDSPLYRKIPLANSAPVIDGRLEDMWQTAAHIDDLKQILPVEGAPPSERTDIYIMYDRDNLYVGARMWDSRGPGSAVSKVMRHGAGLRDEDRVAIVIDPFNAGRSGYRFETNINSVRNDMLYLGSTFQADWSTIWDVASTADDEGWTTEFAIPFKSLPFDPRIQAWGFNFSRRIASLGEEVVWVSRNRNWNPGVAGAIAGLANLDRGIGLDVKAGVAVNQASITADNSETTEVDPSLEAYYRITPSLTGAITINTDFSATEVDDRQVNLSRFGLFFPEKRDFFLNDSDLFEFGRIGEAGYTVDGRSSTRPVKENGRPFFSRRIGLSLSGEPVDLEYGGKATGRIGRLNIGALWVRQDETTLRNGLFVEPSTVAVARGSMNVLGESNVGFVLTDGDPTTNLDNSLIGADFLYRNSRLPGGRWLEADAWYQQSRTEGLSGDDAAWALGVRMPNAEGLRGGIGYREVQQNFYPGVGFISRRGVSDTNAALGFMHVFASGWLQNYSASADFDRIEKLADGRLQTQVVTLVPVNLTLRSVDVMSARATQSRENVDAPFVIHSDPSGNVIVPAGSYSFAEAQAEIVTAAYRRYAGRLTLGGGDFYDGTRRMASTSFQWKPSRHLAMVLDYELNDIELPGGAFITRLARLRTEVAFTVNWTWITLIQYDNESDILGAQTRLRWIPRAGSEVLLAFNRNYEDPLGERNFHIQRTDLTAKANYTFRF